jgi:hypothetical protein
MQDHYSVTSSEVEKARWQSAAFLLTNLFLIFILSLFESAKVKGKRILFLTFFLDEKSISIAFCPPKSNKKLALMFSQRAATKSFAKNQKLLPAVVKQSDF